jgi:hypothetical protein
VKKENIKRKRKIGTEKTEHDHSEVKEMQRE